MKLGKFILPIIIALGVLAYLSFFTVKEINQAIVLQFGDPKRVLSDPGFKVKIPFIISGGISSIEDIKKIKSINNSNVEGIIVGRSIYDGDIKVGELAKQI